MAVSCAEDSEESAFYLQCEMKIHEALSKLIQYIPCKILVCSFRNSLAQWHCAKTLQKANSTLQTVLHSPGQCLG